MLFPQEGGKGLPRDTQQAQRLRSRQVTAMTSMETEVPLLRSWEQRGRETNHSWKGRMLGGLEIQGLSGSGANPRGKKTTLRGSKQGCAPMILPSSKNGRRGSGLKDGAQGTRAEPKVSARLDGDAGGAARG